jgi:hypothetical protein
MAIGRDMERSERIISVGHRAWLAIIKHVRLIFPPSGRKQPLSVLCPPSAPAETGDRYAFGSGY